MPTRSDRRRLPVRLTVSQLSPGVPAAAAPEFPLISVALVAGAASALAGWLLAAALVMVGWFTAMAMPLPVALGFAGQLWLATHGVGLVIGGQLVTLSPLGLTIANIVLIRTVTGLIIRATASEQLQGRGSLHAWGLGAAGYAVTAAGVALACGAGARVGWVLLGGAVVGGLGVGWALAGRLRAQFNPPRVLRWIGPAILAGATATAGIAAAVLAAGLAFGSHRVALIEAALAPDAVGAGLLVGLQLLYLPNLLAWAASWMLGAGISVGAGSVVSPVAGGAGLLPAIPVLGAIPEVGAGAPFGYAWLLSGVVAGVVAGWIAVTRASEGRPKLLNWVARGAAAGLGTAFALFVLAALSRGDLGSTRLVGLGPVLLNLLWLGPTTMVAGGVLAAIGHWFGSAQRTDRTRLDRGEPTPSAALPAQGEAAADQQDTETIILGRD